MSDFPTATRRRPLVLESIYVRPQDYRISRRSSRLTAFRGDFLMTCQREGGACRSVVLFRGRQISRFPILVRQAIHRVSGTIRSYRLVLPRISRSDISIDSGKGIPKRSRPHRARSARNDSNDSASLLRSRAASHRRRDRERNSRGLIQRLSRHLKSARPSLKRYRAAVLKAACEGRLVPTEAELARAEGRDYEPADRMLRSHASGTARRLDGNRSTETQGLVGRIEEWMP